jgi:hypothetical protein
MRVATRQLSPRSFLRLPDSFDLQKTCEERFALVSDPHKVFEGVREKYRTPSMRKRLK